MMTRSTVVLTVAWLVLVAGLLLAPAYAQCSDPACMSPPVYGPPPGYAPMPAGMPGAYGPQDGCGPQCCPRPPLAWGEAALLIGFHKSRYLPALVTTSPSNTVEAQAGVLGFETTETLYGGHRVDPNASLGVRAELGLWLDPYQDIGVGASYFGFEPGHAEYAGYDDGTGILARPFYNTLSGAEASMLASYTDPNPNVSNARYGNIRVSDNNHAFGTDVFARIKMGPGWYADRVDFLGGYQFTEIDSTLSINSGSTIISHPYLATGTRLDVVDSFRAYNVFHGGMLGVRYQTCYGAWSIDAVGKIGLGNMRQRAILSGQTTVTDVAGGVTVTEQGLLVNDHNGRTYVRDRFSVVPEARINVLYHLTQHLSAGVGYSFIYWDRVAMAGELVSRTVDPNLTHPQQPTFRWRESDTFIHALNFTLEYTY